MKRFLAIFRLRYIPNMITFSRIVLTIALIFVRPPLGIASFVIYCVAGLTDIIDGPLARRIPNAKSKFGADLDGFADMFLAVVCIFVIMPVMQIWDWTRPVILVILAFKVVAVAISGLAKHRKFLYLHTIGNKSAAILIFTVPIIYFVIGGHLAVNIYLLILMVWVILITVEEVLILLLLREPNANIRGIWKVNEENKLKLSKRPPTRV